MTNLQVSMHMDVTSVTWCAAIATPGPASHHGTSRCVSIVGAGVAAREMRGFKIMIVPKQITSKSQASYQASLGPCQWTELIAKSYQEYLQATWRRRSSHTEKATRVVTHTL